MEFSRTSGFNDDELWSVQDLPVQPGHMQDFWNYGRNRKDYAFAETTLNGIHLKLFPAKQFTDQSPGNGQIEGGFQIQTDPATDGMRMTLLKVTDGQGHAIQNWNWSQGGTDHRFGLRDLGSVKSLNITLALHRSRFVEFKAKPTKP